VVKLIDRAKAGQGKGRSSDRVLSVLDKTGQLGARLASGGKAKTASQRIPNATLIYSVAAAALLVISLYFCLVLGNWFTGILLFVLSGTLLGYALHFMRHSS